MIAPEDPRQGTTAGYNAGCRCPDCWAAKQRYDKRRRWERLSTGQSRKVPAYRAERRLQALQRLGWSIPVIASKLGLHHQSVYDIGRAPTVYRSRFEKIAALYDELSMTLPVGTNQGERSGITKSRRHAERMGWPPPLAWDDIDDPNARPHGVARDHDAPDFDPVVVERILAGEWRLKANRDERLTVIDAFPGSDNELQRLTGWNVARLKKDRSEAA